MLIEAIKRIGRYFQLDLAYYIRSSFYLILARGAVELSAFLLSVAFARLVTKEMYGQWNFVFSILGICAILTLPGMTTAIAQSVATGHDRILARGTAVRFKWSLLGSLALLGIGAYYLLSDSPVLGKTFMISSLFFPFYTNLEAYSSFLSGKKRFDKIAKYEFIISIISVLVTATVIYVSRELLPIILSYLFSFSLLRGYFFRSTLRAVKNQNEDPAAISFGKHLTATAIPTQIQQHYDKLVIAFFLSFSELAIYAIALGISSLMDELSSIIAASALPKLSLMDQNTAFKEVKRRWPLMFLGTAVICGIVIALCPFVIPLIYTQQYASSVLYAQLLLVSVIIASPVAIINKALFPGQKRVRELYKLRIYTALIGIALLTVMVKYLGLLGAVIAIMLSRTVYLLYSLKLARFISFR